MKTYFSTVPDILGWTFGLAVFAVGVLNALLVHPVPGVAYMLLSLLYLPPANAFLRQRFGFPVPAAVKVILGIVLIQFTLGVSDLGDMID